MGDVRFDTHYERVQAADEPLQEIKRLPDEGVIAALAGASRENNPYLANILATEAMNRARQKHAIVYMAGEGMYVLDHEGRITFLNPAAERMLGWPQAELVGRNMHEAVHYQDSEGHPVPEESCPLMHALRGAETVQRDHGEVFTRKDGSMFPVAYTSAPIVRDDEVEGAVVVFRDVTERYRAEDALATYARQQKVISGLSHDALSGMSLDELVEQASARVTETLGVDYCNALELLPNEEVFELRAGVGMGAAGSVRIPTTNETQAGYTLRVGAPVVVEDYTRETRFEYEFLRRWGIMSGMSVLIGGQDRPFGVLGAHSRTRRKFTQDDVNFLQSVANVLATAIDRRRTEERLAESEERHRLLVQDVRDYAIFGLDAEGRVASWNVGAARLKGYREDEILGQHVSVFYPPEERARGRPEDVLTQAKETGRAEIEGWRVRKDGSRFWGHVALTALRDDEGNLRGFSEVARDLTERRRTEAQREARARQQAAVAELGQAALRGRELTTLMDRTVNLVASTINVDYCKVLELLPDRERLLLRAGVGWQEGLVGRGTVGAELNSQAGYTLASDEPVIVEDLREETRFTGPRLLSHHHVVSGMSVVIEGRDGPFGVLGAHTREKRIFTKDDVNFLQAVANVLASAIQRKHAEDEQQALTERLSEVLESTTDAYFTLDREWRFTYVNAQAEGILRKSRDQLVGRNVWDEFPEAHGSIVQEKYEGVMTTGNPAQFEILYEPLDAWLEVHAYPLKDGISVFFRDVTDRHRAREALEASRARTESILESISDGFVVVDKDWRFTYVNRQAARLLGKERDEILGQNGWEVFPEATGTLFEEEYTRVMQERQPSTFEEWFEPTQKWFETHVHPWQDGISIYFHDVTEKKETERALRNSEARTRAVLEASLQGVITIDADGRVVDWNPAAEQIFGYSRDEIIGEPMAEYIIPERLRQRHYHGLNRYLETEESHILGTRYEFPAIRADGTEFPVEIAIVRIPMSGPPMFTGYVRDITEDKRREQENRQLRERLERSVQRRTRELAEANRELEAFTYSVSHDLRAPLRGIEYFTQALSDEYADRLDDAGREYLTHARRESARLNDLIKDLLSLSRVNREEMEVAHVDLSHVARTIAEDLNRTDPDRDATFHIEDGVTARGDEGLLRVTLENLLGNAWKFTAEKPKAEITFGAEEQDGVTVYYVKDNGAGFDMTAAHKLFAPFQRLHSDSDFGGTGVGLASVQRIVHRHGGEIWAEGQTGKGATFHFTLRAENDGDTRS